MGCEAGPKRLARNVETERRRRLYESFDLETLLHQKGINASDINQPHFLPLEIFDDYTYDCRSVIYKHAFLYCILNLIVQFSFFFLALIILI